MERLGYDLWAISLSPDDHPVRHVRSHLVHRGVVSAEDLHQIESGTRIEVGGIVTHRQRPATADGVTFLNLEDETGTVNIVASVGVWQRYRRVARDAPALIVRGILERTRDGVCSLVADRFEVLPVPAAPASRDFR